ncbi:MAG: uracil-DNA glycosylase, partial [Thermodesulfobacteriota bacterium]
MTSLRQDAARKITDLLDQVKDVLGLYAASGRQGMDCSREALEMAKKWDRPGCLTSGQTTAPKQGCASCPLYQPGRAPVAGRGPVPARLMAISDSPLGGMAQGGKSFSGPEGELLGKILSAMGLAPEAVYVTSLVRCPGPGNAKPAPRALAACRAFLEEEIRKVKPAVIWVMGETAAQALLGEDNPLE